MLKYGMSFQDPVQTDEVTPVQKHIYPTAAPTDSLTDLHHRNTSFRYEQHRRLILTTRSKQEEEHTKRLNQSCRS